MSSELALRALRLIARVTAAPGESRVRHFRGFPPGVSERDQRELLPPAPLILIEETSHGFYLDRYSASGEFCGDTWYRTLEDAQHQATYEYGDRLSEWVQVPHEVEDVVALGRSGSRN